MPAKTVSELAETMIKPLATRNLGDTRSLVSRRTKVSRSAKTERAMTSSNFYQRRLSDQKETVP